MITDLFPGDPTVVGPYKLLKRLGQGGMGVVFLARSPGGRQVAVKVIRPEYANEPGFRTRFAREVGAARNVSGMFTALVVDADTEGPVPWLATAYVPGHSLAEAVETQGALPPASVLQLAAGLAEGLQAIHAAGVVHRDLKPSNVLLAADGPRVIDFGISKAREASMLTQTGMVMGSPGFLSPEQAEGFEVGTPSDVFSLGGVLTYAATGLGPFGSGPTPALMYRVVSREPDLSRVPELVRPLIERCLAKNPAARPTPEQMLIELDGLGAGVGVVTPQWLPESLTSSIARYVATAMTPATPATPAARAAAAPSPVVPSPAAPSPVAQSPEATRVEQADQPAVAEPAAAEPVAAEHLVAEPATPAPLAGAEMAASAAAADPGGPDTIGIALGFPGGATPVHSGPVVPVMPVSPEIPAPPVANDPGGPGWATGPGGPGWGNGPSGPGWGDPAGSGGQYPVPVPLPVPAPRRRDRRLLLIAAAAAIVLIAGLAVGFGLLGGGSGHPSGLGGQTPLTAATKTSASAKPSPSPHVRKSAQHTKTKTVKLKKKVVKAKASPTAAAPSTAPAYAANPDSTTPAAAPTTAPAASPTPKPKPTTPKPKPTTAAAQNISGASGVTAFSCSNLGGTGSIPGGSSVSFSFVNDSSAGVQIYYLAQNDSAELYDTIAAGGSYSPGPATDTEWMVATAGGSCLGIYGIDGSGDISVS